MIPRTAVPSTVFLRSEVPAKHPSAAILGQERMGAGVAVAPDRVLTAHYLVLGASRVEVVGPDGKPRKVRRTAIDHETGLALLSLDGGPLHPVTFRAAADVTPGLPVFIMTCTGRQERKGAVGHVTAVGPFEAFWEYMLDRAIMTTVINPGLAGAALLDADARLIGVVSLGLAAPGRYSLAIPLELFLRHREEMEREDGLRERRRRAWVGFYPQGFDGGVVVTGVVPGGPADRAGLLRGDLVLSVDGASVSTLRELYAAMWKRSAGEPLSLQILRESAIRVVEVETGNRDEFYR